MDADYAHYYSVQGEVDLRQPRSDIDPDPLVETFSQFESYRKCIAR